MVMALLGVGGVAGAGAAASAAFTASEMATLAEAASALGTTAEALIQSGQAAEILQGGAQVAQQGAIANPALEQWANQGPVNSLGGEQYGGPTDLSNVLQTNNQRAPTPTNQGGLGDEDNFWLNLKNSISGEGNDEMQTTAGQQAKQLRGDQAVSGLKEMANAFRPPESGIQFPGQPYSGGFSLFENPGNINLMNLMSFISSGGR